jgi:acetylornithine/succinyldiaminopimelate/putrescine aminotransferase
MDEHVLPTYRRAGPVFVSGKGSQLFDEDGNAFLDLLSGIGVTALGHGHPRWSAAVAEQAQSLAHISNLWRHPYTEQVAGRLARLSGLEAVFFSNSGSEANECALKIARKHQRMSGHPERTGIVALEGGFHGRTFGSLSATATLAYREPFGPGLQATFIQPDDAAGLHRALSSDAAALILEPVQGEGGLRELDRDWLMLARTLCDETGTVLIADEVQCGCGRTGEFLASTGVGLQPDHVTQAKPLAAGLPIGATLVRQELAQVLQPGDHGTTFGGGPMALRGALVFLEELEEGGLAQAVRERGAQLAAGLDDLVARGLAQGRRGRGLMQGLHLPGQAADVQRALLEQGILCGTATADVLRFLPPYVITAQELEQALEALATTLSETMENQS